MEEEFIDKDLGRICIIRNTRAKRVIARRKAECIQLTVPYLLSNKDVLQILDQMKPRLRLVEASPQLTFTPETKLQTISFSLKIENKNVKNYYAKLEDGILTIICPDIHNFEDSGVQSIIKNSIENTMRLEAKRIFPQKLYQLAKLHGFTYIGISINKSRMRWGSCSSKKKINLSYFCLFLPEYLLDFIFLHELCHTIEMNHGQQFWQLLDGVTDNRAKQLTQELKTIVIPW